MARGPENHGLTSSCGVNVLLCAPAPSLLPMKGSAGCFLWCQSFSVLPVCTGVPFTTAALALYLGLSLSSWGLS